jgi:ADP-heptose:LPS heptosyltransferase
LNSHSSLPDDVSEYGIDLRNKTSLAQLASIMDKSFAVCGIDSGPIHLAATTETPVICGFTVVSPEYRVPFGKEKTFFPIDADVECSGCESKWAAAYHNFENCYFGEPTCISTFTADRFIHHIDLLINQRK